MADRMTKEWFEDLLKACDVYLSGVILNQTPGTTAWFTNSACAVNWHKQEVHTLALF